jgi:hypothetical protein
MVLSVTTQPVHICCNQVRSLAADFAPAARLYAESVVQATRTPNAASGSAHDRLRKAVQDARKQTDAAELAFYRHIESHERVTAVRRFGFKKRPPSDSSL